LRQRIQEIKESDQSNADQQLIERGANGEIQLARSHFDFIEKPENDVTPKKYNKVIQAKDKISKVFLKLAREKKSEK
jgi:predicted aspartyl protease